MAARLSTVWILVLASLALAAPAHATFPGANGKIAFARCYWQANYGYCGRSDVYTMNADGSNPVNLTAAWASSYDPAWSPDGTKIAFVGNGLDTMNADGTNIRQVAFGPSTCFSSPTWSPDGTQIAYSTSCPPGGELAGYQIRVVNADGTGNHALVADPNLHIFSPSWSPDGSKIAFMKGPRSDIYSMNPDGSGQTLLLANPGTSLVYSLDWSPNMQKIVFASGRDDGNFPSLYTINPDGSGLIRLTNASVVQNSPVWSPDGTKIAYSECDDETICQPNIKVMNPDASGQTSLTSEPNFGDFHPSWQPLPINTYARPKGASPMVISLVPAYPACTSPDRTHGAPLAFGSCSHPKLTSQNLTVGTPDVNGKRTTMQASIVLKVTGADVKITADANNVFNKDLTDYTGGLRAHLPLQITDKDNTPSPGVRGAATSEQIPFDFDLACTATADTTIGSDCPLQTTANAVVPGSVSAGLRAIWQVGQAQVYDGGADGNPGTTSDNTLYLDQGIFIP